MSNTVSIQPARLDRTLYGADGVTQYASGLGVPANISFTDGNAWLAVALTPTGTTVTIEHGGDESVPGATLANATARINGTGGDALFKTQFLRAWARRKPGATGSITAQKIILKSWDGSALQEIGRIYVSAVAAGSDEPISDVCDIIRNTADSLITFSTSGHPLNVVFESADSDLEFCIEAYGKES